MRKKTKHFICLLILGSSFMNSQHIQGIYLSPNDLIENNLSFKNEIKKCKVKLHEFPYKKEIKIKYGDSTFTLKKDSIFGYMDMTAISYRLFNKHIYKILNPYETILLYETETQGETSKDTRVFTKYYFSENASAPVKELTIANVFNSFQDNPNFQYSIEIYFKTNIQLTEYDPLHKQYKINRLLELSKKQ